MDDGDPRGKGLLWCLSNLTQRVTILGLYSHQQERGREQALCILQGQGPLEQAIGGSESGGPQGKWPLHAFQLLAQSLAAEVPLHKQVTL